MYEPRECATMSQQVSLILANSPYVRKLYSRLSRPATRIAHSQEFTQAKQTQHLKLHIQFIFTQIEFYIRHSQVQQSKL